MKKIMLALVESLSSEELIELVYLAEMRLEHMQSVQGCSCGSGYCPDDNLTYPCFCAQVEDELPF